MANETSIYTGTPKVVESNGVSIANNALAQASTGTYNRASDGAGYPDAEFVLTATFAVAPVEGSSIALYAQPLDVKGTLDTEVPEAARPTHFVGVFIVNNVTTAQTMTLQGGPARRLPALASYYAHNNGCGQSVSAGWTLEITPCTMGPA